ncbi:MAG: HU family DNA-binding protein [Pseudomonadota bacterium]
MAAKPTRKTTSTKSTATKAPAKTASRTTTKAATPRKTATPAKAASAPKPAAQGVTAPKANVPPVVDRELKKKEFLERVAKLSGLKKPQAKAAVEAALALLGEALEKGEAVNLEPLGKMKIQKKKDLGNATVYTCRVRRKKPAAKPPKAPLAKAAE